MRTYNSVAPKIQSQMNEEQKAEKQGEYAKFFMGMLDKFGVDSPAELDDDKRAEFFDKIEKEWTGDTNEGNIGSTVLSNLKDLSKINESRDVTDCKIGDLIVLKSGERVKVKEKISNTTFIVYGKDKKDRNINLSIIDSIVNESDSKVRESIVNEGQFSWMTHNGGRQIGSENTNRITVYMFDDKGNRWEEKKYDGYGVFGGMDYYELLATMNGFTEADGKKGDFRQVGIDVAFEKIKTKAPGRKILYPALVSNKNYNWKQHDFTKEADSDPNQSWDMSNDNGNIWESTKKWVSDYASNLNKGWVDPDKVLYDLYNDIKGGDNKQDRQEIFNYLIGKGLLYQASDKNPEEKGAKVTNIKQITDMLEESVDIYTMDSTEATVMFTNPIFRDLFIKECDDLLCTIPESGRSVLVHKDTLINVHQWMRGQLLRDGEDYYVFTQKNTNESQSCDCDGEEECNICNPDMNEGDLSNTEILDFIDSAHKIIKKLKEQDPKKAAKLFSTFGLFYNELNKFTNP